MEALRNLRVVEVGGVQGKHGRRLSLVQPMLQLVLPYGIRQVLGVHSPAGLRRVVVRAPQAFARGEQEISTPTQRLGILLRWGQRALVTRSWALPALVQ